MESSPSCPRDSALCPFLLGELNQPPEKLPLTQKVREEVPLIYFHPKIHRALWIGPNLSQKKLLVLRFHSTGVLFGCKIEGVRFLVYLVVQSSTRETHLFSPKDAHAFGSL